MDYYGVIGNPIQHSKSPLIHRLFAEQTNQLLVYEPILVELDDLAHTLSDLETQGWRGLNVTRPFKQRVVPLMDQLSPRAERAKAVNTIQFNSDGTRFGDNTDGVGLVRDILLNQNIILHDKQILIVGAGGAVRGVIDALLAENPAQLVIANRTASKASKLADEFADAGRITAADLFLLKNNTFDLIINGTSASLPGDWPDLPASILNKDAYCYDMVYGVGLTPFLEWAKRSGATRYSDGLGMLVEQAAESFFIWRGIKPDTKPVLSTLSALIGKKE